MARDETISLLFGSGMKALGGTEMAAAMMPLCSASMPPARDIAGNNPNGPLSASCRNSCAVEHA
jgi:hypothetical protein